MAQKQSSNSSADWERELENLGRSLGKEMRNLGHALSQSVNWDQTLRGVSSGLGRAAQELGRAAGEVSRSAGQAMRAADAPRKKERQRKKFFKKLRGNYEALRGTALGLGLAAFVIAMAGLITIMDGDPEAVVLWVVAAAFAVPAVICKVRSYAALRLVSYHQVIEGRSYCTLQELSAAVDLPEYKTLREVRKMLRQGKFSGMFLAPDGSRLFSNRMAYAAYNDAQAAHAAAQQKAQDKQPQPAGESAAGNNRENGITDELAAFLKGLRAEKTVIQDPDVASQVNSLEQSTENLIAWIKTHPASEKKVRRFAAYYLPTTLKLLHTYNEVDAQADQSTVAAEIQRDIVGILHTINQAFATLQDGLLQDTALNVSAEISALETVLSQDGLAGDQGFALK